MFFDFVVKLSPPRTSARAGRCLRAFRCSQRFIDPGQGKIARRDMPRIDDAALDQLETENGSSPLLAKNAMTESKTQKFAGQVLRRHADIHRLLCVQASGTEAQPS